MLPVLLENPVDLAAMLNIVLAPAEVNLVVLDLVPKAETPWLLVPVQLVPVVMSAPPVAVPVPAAGQAAKAAPPIKASKGAAATAVRRTLRMELTL